MIKPETAHPAFDKACHLFGVELRRAPIDPATAQVDVEWVDAHCDDQTIAIVGSACNYGYGTIDPIGPLSDWRCVAASGSMWTPASADSPCRSGRSSAMTSRSSTTGCPA